MLVNLIEVGHSSLVRAHEVVACSGGGEETETPHLGQCYEVEGSGTQKPTSDKTTYHDTLVHTASLCIHHDLTSLHPPCITNQHQILSLHEWMPEIQVGRDL
jgi:hypothetical protein